MRKLFRGEAASEVFFAYFLVHKKVSGGLERTRTSDLPLIRRALSPPELQAHVSFWRRSSFLRLPTPCGGDEEDRTPDPLLARQVLSQLSYTPK